MASCGSYVIAALAGGPLRADALIRQSAIRAGLTDRVMAGVVGSMIESGELRVLLGGRVDILRRVCPHCGGVL